MLTLPEFLMRLCRACQISSKRPTGKAGPDPFQISQGCELWWLQEVLFASWFPHAQAQAQVVRPLIASDGVRQGGRLTSAVGCGTTTMSPDTVLG